MPLTSLADVDAAELVLEDNTVEKNLVLVIIHILFLGLKWNNSIDTIGNILRITMMPNGFHRALPQCCVTVCRCHAATHYLSCFSLVGMAVYII
jgi:hypothetical protein